MWIYVVLSSTCSSWPANHLGKIVFPDGQISDDLFVENFFVPFAHQTICLSRRFVRLLVCKRPVISQHFSWALQVSPWQVPVKYSFEQVKARGSSIYKFDILFHLTLCRLLFPALESLQLWKNSRKKQLRSLVKLKRRMLWWRRLRQYQTNTELCHTTVAVSTSLWRDWIWWVRQHTSDKKCGVTLERST